MVLAPSRIAPADRSRAVLEETLRAAGNDDVTLIVFPGAGHGFWIVRDDGGAWDWPRQTPGCAATMVEWAVARARSARAAP